MNRRYPQNDVSHRELALDRCPHCHVDTPNLRSSGAAFETQAMDGGTRTKWRLYACSRCGGVTLASQRHNSKFIDTFPSQPGDIVDDALPDQAKRYIRQAIDSVARAPDGAVMIAASSVDAMLKARGLTTGSLYSRINEATERHIITPDMKEWAHEVRLEANDQRHADGDAPENGTEDAQRVVDFALALGQYLFVLPERVRQGRDQPSP